MTERFLNRTSDAIVVVSLLGAGMMLMVPREVGHAATVEGGPIESLSSLVLGCSVIVAGLALFRGRTLGWVSVCVVLLWLYLRELDYQKLFTPKSIESTGFYLRADMPTNAKIIAAAAMIPCFVAFAHVVFLARKRLRVDRRLRRCFYSALALALGSRLAEKFTSAAALVEEPLEAGFATQTLLVVSALTFGRRPTEAKAERDLLAATAERVERAPFS